jgi:predicted LPLAT superfamily acyltransferase
MFCMQVGSKHEIHFERFRDSVRLPRKDRNTELAVLARDYAARLEHFCLRAPYQWFNFYDFWRMPGSEVNDASR